MSDILTILLILGLVGLLIIAVIYEPAWQELIKRREARRRREMNDDGD